MLIYVSVLLAVVVVIGRITAMFNKNLENVAYDNDASVAFSNFNACLLTETKKKDNTVTSTGKMVGNDSTGYHFETGSSPSSCTAVTFSTKNSISYVNKTIFYNKVKICSNVDYFNISFNKSQIGSEKDSLDIVLKIGTKTYENTYTFR